jgi:signal transduction histidine kinase
VQVIDPAHIPENTLAPPMDVNALIADRKAYPLESVIRLPPLTRDLEIDYTALSFAAPEKVMFRYMLEGHDVDWQEAGIRRQAFYNDLGPGPYHFRVIARNNDGLWNEAGASLNLSVLPAFYQTTWFRALCAFAFLGLLWLVYELRVRQLQQKFAAVLDARVNERTRIARDLHDTVLQSLHGLLLSFQRAANLLPERPLEAKERLEGAIDQAAQAITEGREAVQGLRSFTVVTTELAVAIRTLGEELAAKQTSQNPPVFDVAVEGTSRDLNPILRDDIYRIAGEALRNAFQHAQAGHIEVEIHYDEVQLRVRIRDDGKGVDADLLSKKERSGHWGLPGMRERAKLVGGQLEIWSQLNSGTEIELRIPASIAYLASAPRQSRNRTAMNL